MLIMLSISGEILFYKKAKIKLTTNEFKMLEFLMKERYINKKTPTTANWFAISGGAESVLLHSIRYRNWPTGCVRK
jgi:hypothetical protein